MGTVSLSGLADDVLAMLPTGEDPRNAPHPGSGPGQVPPIWEDAEAMEGGAAPTRPNQASPSEQQAGPYQVDSGLLSSLPPDQAQDLLGSLADTEHLAGGVSHSSSSSSRGSSADRSGSIGAAQGSASSGVQGIATAAATMLPCHSASPAPQPPPAATPAAAAASAHLEPSALLEFQLAQALGTLAVTTTGTGTATGTGVGTAASTPLLRLSSGSSSGSGSSSCLSSEHASPRFSSPGPAPPGLCTIPELAGLMEAEAAALAAGAAAVEGAVGGRGRSPCGGYDARCGGDVSLAADEEGEEAGGWEAGLEEWLGAGQRGERGEQEGEDIAEAVCRLLAGGAGPGARAPPTTAAQSPFPGQPQRKSCPSPGERAAEGVAARSNGAVAKARGKGRPAWERKGWSGGDAGSDSGSDAGINPGALMYARQKDWKERNEKRYAAVREQEAAAGLEGCTFTPQINPRSRQLQRSGVHYPDKPLPSSAHAPSPRSPAQQQAQVAAGSPAVAASATATSPASARGRASSSTPRPASSPPPGERAHFRAPSPSPAASPTHRPASALSGAQACLQQLQYAGRVAQAAAAAGISVGHPVKYRVGYPAGYPAASEQLAGVELAGVAPALHTCSPGVGQAGTAAGQQYQQLYHALSFGSQGGEEGCTNMANVPVPGSRPGSGHSFKHRGGSTVAGCGIGGNIDMAESVGEGAEDMAGGRDWSPARRSSSWGSANTASLISPRLGDPSERAGRRLYAHAVARQRRQKEAARGAVQRELVAAAEAAPRARPLPSFYHNSGKTVSLMDRARSPSPPSRAAAAAAAEEAQLFRPSSATHKGDPQSAAAYYQKFNLSPGPNFEEFLARQERFAQALHEGLERERAGLCPTKPAMALGTRRILEQKQREQQDGGSGRDDGAGSREGRASEGSNTGRSSRAGTATSAGRAGSAGRVGPSRPGSAGAGGRSIASALCGAVLRSVGMGKEQGGGDDEEAAGWAVTGARSGGSASASRNGNLAFRPQITKKGESKAARSPEELHAQWEVLQEKLAQKRAAAEGAEMRECSFRPALSPAPKKYAAVAPNLQNVDAYLAAQKEKLRAREEQHIKAHRQKEAQELGACTFHPAINHYKFDIHRTVMPRAPSPTAAAAAARPASRGHSSGGVPGQQALAYSHALTQAAGGPKRECMAQVAPSGMETGEGTGQGSGRLVPASGRQLEGRGALSFNSYLDRVLFELQQVQAAEGVPAVWGLGGGQEGQEGWVAVPAPAEEG